MAAQVLPFGGASIEANTCSGPSVSPKCFSNAAFAALFYCVGCPT